MAKAPSTAWYDGGNFLLLAPGEGVVGIKTFMLVLSRSAPAISPEAVVGLATATLPVVGGSDGPEVGGGCNSGDDSKLGCGPDCDD